MCVVLRANLEHGFVFTYKAAKIFGVLAFLKDFWGQSPLEVLKGEHVWSTVLT